MAEYTINKGIGRNAEFKGLKAQYLLLFAGGLLSVFILFVVLYMVGINSWICIIIGVVAATILVQQTFSLNRKYGEHGLAKRQGLKKHPKYLISRRRIFKLFNHS
jgi:5-bromo-4-chloroindolyl phosphate hydrolysis protein